MEAPHKEEGLKLLPSRMNQETHIVVAEATKAVDRNPRLHKELQAKLQEIVVAKATATPTIAEQRKKMCRASQEVAL